MKSEPNSLSEIESIILQTAGEMAESLSINRVVGQIYSLLYISPKPVSLEDIADKLKISKGSVSVNIRNLEDWNAVKKVFVPGSRKDFYTAESDFMKIISDRLQKGLSRRLQYANEKLQHVEILINDQSKDKDLKTFYQSRLKHLVEIKELLDSLLFFLPQIRSLSKNKLLTALLKK